MHASLTPTDFRGGPGPHIVGIPGILTHSQMQLEPLMPVFKRYNPTISGMDYRGEHFDPRTSVNQIVQMIERNLTIGHPMVPFASSLGGMLTALALTKLREGYSVTALNQLVHTIIIDAPSGSRDLKQVPERFYGVATRFTKRFNPKRENAAGRTLAKMMRVGPKDHEIELTEGGPTAQQIKDRAIEGLTGHSSLIWYQQVQWMLRTELDLNKLDGLDITYIACVGKGNETVRQPQALEAWQPHVKKVIEVDTPHCAYLQAQPTYITTLTPLLDELLREHVA